MSRKKQIGLSALFLMISIFVSGSLVFTAQEARAAKPHFATSTASLAFVQSN